MDDLDPFGPIAHAHAREAARLQQREELRGGLDSPGGLLDDRNRKGSTTDCDEFENLASVVRQARGAVLDHPLKGEEIERALSRGCCRDVAAHKFVDEKRAPLRFACDRVRDELRRRVHLIEQSQREATRVGALEGPDLDLTHVDVRGPSRVQVQEKGALARFFTAVCRQEEQGRLVRGANELEEQRGAVDVAPVHVIDEHDEQAAARECREELPQGGKRAQTNHPRIVHLRLCRIFDACYAP